MAAVSITRMDHTAKGFRQVAARCRDAPAARWMLALALVAEGVSRGEAARACLMDRQTLLDWVHRYHADGLAGLSDCQGGNGPPRRLSPAREAWGVEQVRQGSDWARHGVVRWRRIDLARAIAAEFGITLAERTVGALVHRLGLRRILVRPCHPEQDSEEQRTHKKLRRSSPSYSSACGFSSPEWRARVWFALCVGFQGSGCGR